MAGKGLNRKFYKYCLRGRQEEGYRRDGKACSRKSQIKSGKTKKCNFDDDGGGGGEDEEEEEELRFARQAVCMTFC
jgi:hypothetical protein